MTGHNCSVEYKYSISRSTRYAITILCVCLVSFLVPPPVERGLACFSDFVIFHVKPETVGPLFLASLSTGSIIISVTLVDVAIICRMQRRRRISPLETGCFRSCILPFVAHVCESILLAFAGSFATWLLVDVIKVTASVYRPDLLDTCGLTWNDIACSPGQLVFLRDFNCSLSEKKLDSGLESFPSGHAATIFFSAVFSCVYIDRNLKVPDGGSRLRLFSLALILLASWVSATRVRDNRHHIGDVLAGVVIGTAMGFLTTLQSDKSSIFSVAQSGMESTTGFFTAKSSFPLELQDHEKISVELLPKDNSNEAKVNEWFQVNETTPAVEGQ